MDVKLNSKFERACKKVTTDPSYDREKYLHLKLDEIPLVSLKRGLKDIAINYIPHTLKSRSTKFPAEVIVKIASVMKVYVTDITTLGR